MGRMNNPVRRISQELWEEIRKISDKNNIGRVEASRNLAKFIQQNRNRKRRIYDDIQF